EQTRFDLNELIRLVLIGAEQRIEDKKLEVSIDLPEEAWAYADPDQIRRVLNNLTDNAIKFTPEAGNIDISVKLRNGKYHIAIGNSGAGIDSEELPHLFERFYKSDKSRGEDKNGAGLGLYMVRNILNQHGEEIRVESIQNEKTTFFFTIKKASLKEPS
ncbi:MAG: HAMP domain-containing histidine kinase, partial [Clostridia bacterium]|nr:HAMP domain-containing histidine kinase [Clostridia bacterium]